MASTNLESNLKSNLESSSISPSSPQSLNIVTWPHPILSQVAQPVSHFDDQLDQFIQNMWTCLADSGGIGLAAPQVNCSQQIFIMHCQGRVKQAHKLTCINPHIISHTERIPSDEGCLSFPSIRVTVPRFNQIYLRAQNKDGTHFEIHLQGLEAICVQHEMDHLAGKSFLDLLSESQRMDALMYYADLHDIPLHTLVAT